MLQSEIKETVAQKIKHQTAAAHEELENLLIPKLLAIQSKKDYATILKIFYSYFKPLEIAIGQHIKSTLLPDIEERRKASAILNDLESVGYPLNNFHIDTNEIPVLTNTIQAFGALYVLEGSTLGGKVITKMLLKSNAGLQPGNVQFFYGYGEATGSRWKDFLTVLNGLGNDVNAIHTLIEKANETFVQFKYVLQKNL